MRPFDINDRTTYLGCSDLGALLNLLPEKWGRNRQTLLMEKTGRAPPVAQNMAMRVGQLLEDDVLTLMEEAVPGLSRVETNHRVAHPRLPFFGAQCDALYENHSGRLLCEAKTAAFLSKDWGRPGTDEIPGFYMAQVQGQLECTGLDAALVPLLVLGKRELLVFQVHRDAEVGRQIAETVERFWTEEVETYWARRAA